MSYSSYQKSIGKGFLLTKESEGLTFYSSLDACKGILVPVKVIEVSENMVRCFQEGRNVNVPLHNGRNSMIIDIHTAGRIVYDVCHTKEMDLFKEYQQAQAEKKIKIAEISRAEEQHEAELQVVLG